MASYFNVLLLSFKISVDYLNSIEDFSTSVLHVLLGKYLSLQRSENVFKKVLAFRSSFARIIYTITVNCKLYCITP